MLHSFTHLCNQEFKFQTHVRNGIVGREDTNLSRNKTEIKIATMMMKKMIQVQEEGLWNYQTLVKVILWMELHN